MWGWYSPFDVTVIFCFSSLKALLIIRRFVDVSIFLSMCRSFCHLFVDQFFDSRSSSKIQMLFKHVLWSHSSMSRMTLSFFAIHYSVAFKVQQSKWTQKLFYFKMQKISNMWFVQVFLVPFVTNASNIFSINYYSIWWFVNFESAKNQTELKNFLFSPMRNFNPSTIFGASFNERLNSKHFSSLIFFWKIKTAQSG